MIGSVQRRFSFLFLCLALMLVSIEAGVAQDTGTPEAGTPEVEEAASGPVIAFFPSDQPQGGFFSVELDPGESTTQMVTLGNAGSVPFDAVTYAADAYTIRNGGMGLRDLEDEQTGPTTWLDYPIETFATEPGEGFEREFTITVPEETAPGEYVAGIAMQTAEPVNEEATEGMFRFDQYYRTVVGIRILVPGDLAPELTFGEPQVIVEGGLNALIVPITNTGNQQTSPSGDLRLTDQDGNIVLTAPVQMGRIYGGHETELWLGLSNPLPEGEYSVDLSLSDPDKDLTATLDEGTLAVAEPATPVMATIAISSATVTPMPAADNVQFANVEAVITNNGEPVANAQLSLVAYVDGEEVERFPISQSLSLPGGNTDVVTRYLPLTGWTSGEWTFELLLETVDSNGAAVVVASQPIEGTVTIP